MASSLRLRSTLTQSCSAFCLAVVSNSSQAPRLGMTFALKSLRPVVGSSVAV